MKIKNKKIFVDFENAFDKVWRDGLWYTLLLNNMNGYMYHVILNMYNGTKSCISYNHCKSDFVPCNNGARQGKRGWWGMVSRILFVCVAWRFQKSLYLVLPFILFFSVFVVCCPDFSR